MGIQSRPIRFLPLFFLLSAIIELSRFVFIVLWQRFLFLPNVFSSPVFSAEAAEFSSALLSFAISPVLLFVAFYFLGRGANLNDDLLSPAVSIFLGGVVSDLIGILIEAPLYGQGFTPPYNFFEGWNIGILSIEMVSSGLGSMFAGISAILFASYRAHRAGVADLGQATQDPSF